MHIMHASSIEQSSAFSQIKKKKRNKTERRLSIHIGLWFIVYCLFSEMEYYGMEWYGVVWCSMDSILIR